MIKSYDELIDLQLDTHFEFKFKITNEYNQRFLSKIIKGFNPDLEYCSLMKTIQYGKVSFRQTNDNNSYRIWDYPEINEDEVIRIFKKSGITLTSVDDMIQPHHYKTDSIDVIDICKILDLNFNRGNVLKYISRAGKKDNELQDLNKAMEYLRREIKHVESKLNK